MDRYLRTFHRQARIFDLAVGPQQFHDPFLIHHQSLIQRDIMVVNGKEIRCPPVFLDEKTGNNRGTYHRLFTGSTGIGSLLAPLKRREPKVPITS